MDRRAWWATVYGATMSWTRQSTHTHTHTHTHLYKLSQFGVSQKLTQQCKSTVLKKKEKDKKTRNVRRIEERITVCVKRMCMYFSYSEIIRVRCGGDVKQFPGHTKTHQQRVESSLAQLNLRTTSK